MADGTTDKDGRLQYLYRYDRGEKKVAQVEIKEQDNSILFTDNEDNIYKTAMVKDKDLTERLYEAGASFSGEEIQQMSPLLSFILTWILPLVIFIGIGQLLSKKMMEKAGGKNSMMFGMGKSNAKVYVKSSKGIKFADVAGEDEAKESLAEIVDYLHDSKNIRKLALRCRKEFCL